MSYPMGAAFTDRELLGGEEQSDADWAFSLRDATRTHRLLRLIDRVEVLMDETPDEAKAMPELRERHANLTRTLLNHRKLGR